MGPMCVVALAWQAHPDWLLVAAGNRDELHDRPAAPIGRWDAAPHVLAGRDLRSAGTWLGVSEEGRFAVVTNLRGYGEPRPDRASRGALLAGLLTGTGAYADPRKASLSDFNPFNLIVIDRSDAHFLSNRPADIRSTLAHGLYGVSNGMLDEPWPKTMQLKAALSDWMVDGARQPERLIDSLRIDTLSDVGVHRALPSDVPLEAPLSPVFIRNSVYGTRCSTVVAIGRDGHGVMIERRYTAGGEVSGESRLAFSWPC